MANRDLLVNFSVQGCEGVDEQLSRWLSEVRFGIDETSLLRLVRASETVLAE